jgi:iron complex transport system substrate-binding protein
MDRMIGRIAARAALGALLWSASAAGAELVVVDDAGVGHRFAAPLERVVTLAPHLTELVYAVGAGASVVGRDAYSDFPAAARAVPSIGDAFRLDLERVVALRAQAVLAWGGGTPAAVVEKVRALGIPVVLLEPRSLEDPARHLELVGALTGRSAQAEVAARRYRERLYALRVTHSGATPVRVFYQVNEQPLYTVNGLQPIGLMIALCGGVNAFADLAALAPVVNEEAVVASDPQVILTGAGEGGTADGLRRRWGRWPGLAATKAGAFHALDADLVTRPGPRMVEGAAAVCSAIDYSRITRAGAAPGRY